MTIPPGAAQLDREVGRLRESYWEKQKLAAVQKTVLLVEGDDDRDVIETFLQRRSPAFSARVRVVPAGGRTRVLSRMKTFFPQAYALVDRDTWTDAEVDAHRRAQPRLYVTEGWCLENVFFGPDALRRQDARVAAEISSQREHWVRAGALWWTLQRTRDAQQRWQEALGWSYGSLRPDLDLSSAQALADSLNQKIHEDERRDSTLDIVALAETFAARCNEVLALPEAQQWQIGVHGKSAFSNLLVPTLRSTPRAVRLNLANQIDRPSPIDELIAFLLP